jgi:hypothetical protein
MRRMAPLFRSKAPADVGHDQVHGAQHVGQHMVGLSFRWSVRSSSATYGGCPGGRRRCNRSKGLFAAVAHFQQHQLGSGQRTHQRLVFGHQHSITTTHHLAAWQKTRWRPAESVASKRLFLSQIPVDLDLGGALQQHGSRPRPGDEFVDE